MMNRLSVQKPAGCLRAFGLKSQQFKKTIVFLPARQSMLLSVPRLTSAQIQVPATPYATMHYTGAVHVRYFSHTVAHRAKMQV
jgi:hypothetical protein